MSGHDGAFLPKMALNGVQVRKQSPISWDSVDRACSRSHWLNQHPAESLSSGSRTWKGRMSSLREGAALEDGITKRCTPESQRGFGNHVLISSHSDLCCLRFL